MLNCKAKIFNLIMKPSVLTIMGALFLFTTFLAQPKPFLYKKMWQKVDSLERKGLTKSALEVVQKIHQAARQDNLPAQVVKSYIYLFKFRNIIEEDAYEKLLTEISLEAYNVPFPYSSLYHTLSAEFFWQYYLANRYHFHLRTYSPDEGEDIRSWSLEHLASVIIKHHLKALESREQLQKIPLKQFNEILVENNYVENLRPTLYDFLAFRAVEFFSSKEISLTKPADTFELNDSLYFADVATFLKLNPSTNDSLSLQYYGIRILQDILAFHLNDDQPDAFIDAELSRLEFVYRNTVLENKSDFYLKSLNRLYVKYSEHPFSNAIAYQIVTLMSAMADTYRFEDSTTHPYRYYMIKAMELAQQAIQKYPSAFHTPHLKNFIISRQKPSLSFEIEDATIPNEPFAVKYNYRNLETIYTQIRAIDRKTYDNLLLDYYDNELLKKIYLASTLVQERIIKLPKNIDYQPHSVEEIYQGLPLGFYVIFVSSDADFMNTKAIRCIQRLYSTNIAVVSFRNEDGSHTILVTNRKDGSPISNASITEYWLEYGQRKHNFTKGQSYQTNSNGMATILLPDNPLRKKSYGNVYIEINTSQETYFSEQYFYTSPYYKSSSSKNYSISLFTDRAIYRPGQIVYYKGIIIEQQDQQRNIVPSFQVSVLLRDANYQPVEEQMKTSNDFGTFNGSFKIPEGLLNGVYTLTTPYGSCHFRVEEYKRPRFFVEAEAIDKEYYLNDTVIVKAMVKSYTGNPLQQIPVKYKITRIPRWRGYEYYYQRIPSVVISSGSVNTDEQGIAVIRFKAIPDLKYPLNESTFYQYKIEIDATDINQETQSTECYISAGTIGLFFSLSLPSFCTANDLKSIALLAQNANGKKINVTGTYRIYRLEENRTPQRSRLWSDPDTYLYTEQEWKQLYPGNVYKRAIGFEDLKPVNTVFSANFDTQKDTAIIIPNAHLLPSGSYLIEIKSADRKGKEVIHRQAVILYSFDNNTLIPVNEALMIMPEKMTYKPGEYAKIAVGSAYNDAKVLMNIAFFNNPEQYQWINLIGQQINIIEIPIQEHHRGNIILSFLMVKQSRIYRKEITLHVPYDNKELNIKTETFRSKIYPGQQETWKLRIIGKNGERVASELLASMYDKSLDAFVNHQWSFAPYPYFYNNRYSNQEMFDVKYSNCYTYYESSPSLPSLTYPKLNLFGFRYYGAYRYRNGYGKKAAQEKIAQQLAYETMDAEPPSVSKQEITASETMGLKKQESTPGSTSDVEVKLSIRSNLNETAFFFPELKTNERGEVEFTFTSPEALTTWKFMAFAHSKDLKYGFLQTECITQKELMVTPQLPRFFREGDSIMLYIKVDNISNNEQKVTVSLKIEDALQQSKAFSFSQSTSITLKSNQSEAVSFMYYVPFNLSMAKVTCVAQSKNFSDGEEVVLPVLPNRMLVTESMPFYIRGKQSKQLNFKRIDDALGSNTLTHHTLTLEYTANPIWYAIKAIPYLRSFPFECNEQLFNRYYSNVLSQYIVLSIPNFKQIFQQWTNDSTNKPLLSPLSKNEELKQASLAETPWIEESLNEGEQRKNVALYFDEKRIQKELNEAADKLIKNQYSNGAWGWFAGMPENRYITQYIVSRNGRLEKAYHINTKLTTAMDKAIQYIDQQLVKDYKEVLQYTKKEALDKYVPDVFTIQYLYARSFYLNKNKSFLQSEAYRFFYQQAKKHWLSYGEYVQGMLALVLHRNNDSQTAKDIVRSLKERCVVSDEQGMYWKSISRGLSWTEAPIEAQSLLIEAFHEVSDDAQTVNELKLWLLLQKQTQNWKTTMATADAVYALLFFGESKLSTSFDANIVWGDKPLPIDKQANIEKATGYIKTTLKEKEIQPKYSKIQIENKGNDLSWGALHWQYFENIDKISTYDSKYMSLKREYYLEKMTPSGKKLEPLSGKVVLKTGDIVVVKLVIECDRTLEFVHIKDMRPSSFEPVQALSGYVYRDGLGYYSEIKDASLNIFIDRMNRGKYVIEYPLRVSQKGTFSTGISTIQCMYAPEFNAHARGMRIVVN